MSYDFYAMEDIKIGSELLLNYETCEFCDIGISESIICDKKNVVCKGCVKGYKYNKEFIDLRYGNYISDYLKM